MMPEYTEADWLAELEALGIEAGGDEGLSVAEMVEATGKTEQAVRLLLRRGIAASRVTCGRARRPSIDGTHRPVPVYRIVRSGE